MTEFTMPGRDPKPASQRRRRNIEPVTGQKLVADSAACPDAPDGLLSETLGDWERWWSSPMAAIWLEADVPAIVRLARLTDAAKRGDAGAAVLGEIRQLEDRLGLSPLARRRLAWEVSQVADVEADGPVIEQDARWLRVVSD